MTYAEDNDLCWRMTDTGAPYYRQDTAPNPSDRREGVVYWGSVEQVFVPGHRNRLVVGQRDVKTAMEAYSFKHPDHQPIQEAFAIAQDVVRGADIAKLSSLVFGLERDTARDAYDKGPKDTNPKTVYGEAKPPMDLLPGSALVELSMVLALGKAKYGNANWRVDPVSFSTYAGALLRHLVKAIDGETIDPESGRPHMAHVMANAAIILDAKACGTLIDDRPPKGASAATIEAATKPIKGVHVYQDITDGAAG